VKQLFKKISLETKKQFELVDVTEKVADCVREAGVVSGIALVYSPHTTAAIRLNHNEPLLIQDMMKSLYHLIPIDVSYSHDLFEMRQNVGVNERSNGHAHVKAFWFGSSETVAVEQSKLMLGEKQSIFFIEFDGGRSRDFWVKILGE